MFARKRRVHSITPVLVVSDVRKSAAFYCNVLGFEDPSFHGEPACFCMLNRDGFEIMLSLAAKPSDVHPNGPAGTWDVYLRVADVAAEREGIERAGAKLVGEPRETFYSMREIDVDDPDGHRICLAEDVS